MASLFHYSGPVVTKDSVTAKVCDGKKIVHVMEAKNQREADRSG